MLAEARCRITPCLVLLLLVISEAKDLSKHLGLSSVKGRRAQDAMEC